MHTHVPFCVQLQPIVAESKEIFINEIFIITCVYLLISKLIIVCSVDLYTNEIANKW
jgi:hypothetical protein